MEARRIDNHKVEPGFRLARCTQCTKTTYSHPFLDLWQWFPSEEEDAYYCGCALYD